MRRDSRPPLAEARFAGARYLREHEDRLAWIMGSSRSGSTWLLRMLSELEPVVGMDDPHLGHHLGVWRPLPLAWATATEPPELRTLLDVKRSKPDFFFSERSRDAWLPALRDLIAARLGARLEDAGPPVPEPTLVVKEPGSQAAELIFEAFPGSRLVFLLRDGRDVVDSWLDAYRRGSWAIEEGAYPVEPAKRLPLVKWLASVWVYRTRAVASVFERLAPGHAVLVRYEDLLRSPATELARVCEALGIAADSRALAAIASVHALERVEPERRGPLREVRSGRPGGWQRRLTAAEQRAVNAIMAAELERFGYRRRGRAAAA